MHASSTALCCAALATSLACGDAVAPAPDAATSDAAVSDAALRDTTARADTLSGDSSDAVDAAAPDATSLDTASLVVWTYNILNPSNPGSGGADVEQRTQIVIDAINAAQPDLIALQEVVDSSSVPNRAEHIAAATGYHWEWEQEYSAVIYDEGIAVLSRWPILEREAIDLPHLDLVIFQRKLLRARVDHPRGPIDMYCTHMTVGGSEEQSADQALAAYQLISSHAGEALALFAGDLNAEPDTLSMRFLRGEQSHDGVTADLTDAWLATNPGVPGYTISPEDPHDRIDYIYLAPSAPAAPTARGCALIFDQQVDGVFASDHIGVACEIALPGAPP